MEHADFVSDFPKRCLDILDGASSLASLTGREVTLLLVVASASLLVPFERLRPDTEHSAHAFGDNKLFAEGAEKLQRLLATDFVGSVLCPSLTNSWRFSDSVLDVSGGLDSWYSRSDLKVISASKKGRKGKAIKSMLPHIRNALAHGSIYTKGKPIEELIFVQERTAAGEDGARKRIGFEVLSVSPDDFNTFIRGWIACLVNEKAWELRRVT